MSLMRCGCVRLKLDLLSHSICTPKSLKCLPILMWNMWGSVQNSSCNWKFCWVFPCQVLQAMSPLCIRQIIFAFLPLITSDWMNPIFCPPDGYSKEDQLSMTKQGLLQLSYIILWDLSAISKLLCIAMNNSHSTSVCVNARIKSTCLCAIYFWSCN